MKRRGNTFTFTDKERDSLKVALLIARTVVSGGTITFYSKQAPLRKSIDKLFRGVTGLRI